MLNIVRQSQVIGLMVVDSSTASYLGEVEEVWLDPSQRVRYFSIRKGFLPLEQVAGVSTQAVWTYGQLPIPEPMNLSRSHLTVLSAERPVGQIEDILFDWETGEIAAYIVTGEIAEVWGGRAVLEPSDVDQIVIDSMTLRESAQLHSETGLREFFSEKSHQVRHLIKLMSDRLHHLIDPHDHPEIVRIKIKAVGDEFAESHDHHTIQEAIAFLQAQWHHLQQSIDRANHRAKAAFDSAWKHLTRQI